MKETRAPRFVGLLSPGVWPPQYHFWGETSRPCGCLGCCGGYSGWGAVAEHSRGGPGYVPCTGWKIISRLTWLAFSRFVMIMATSSALRRESKRRQPAWRQGHSPPWPVRAPALGLGSPRDSGCCDGHLKHLSTSSTVGMCRHCRRLLSSALGTTTAYGHDRASPAAYLDAASSSYLHRSSSSSVWVAFSAGRRKRRVSRGVGVWPPVAGGPCPGPPTCVEHFDLLLCLPQPSGQSDLCFLQPPARDGHQRCAGGTAAMPTPQSPEGTQRPPRCVPITQ